MNKLPLVPAGASRALKNVAEHSVTVTNSSEPKTFITRFEIGTGADGSRSAPSIVRSTFAEAFFALIFTPGVRYS